MKNLKVIALILLTLMLAACASEPSKFYVLNPTRTKGTLNKQVKLHIGLEKVQLAQYLQKPQIITRKTNHELKLSEFNRWAEPLKENIQQVLQTNLEHMLINAVVANYPWKASLKPAYTIKVNITKFDTNALGRSILQVNFKIKSKDGKILTVFSNKKYITQVNPENYNSIVAGMNRNLTMLSRSLASLLSRKPK